MYDFFYAPFNRASTVAFICFSTSLNRLRAVRAPYGLSLSKAEESQHMCTGFFQDGEGSLTMYLRCDLFSSSPKR